MAILASSAYAFPMDNTCQIPNAPFGWLDAIAEREADLASGRTVPAEVVHRRVSDCIVRIEAGQAVAPASGAAGHL